MIFDPILELSQGSPTDRLFGVIDEIGFVDYEDRRVGGLDLKFDRPKIDRSRGCPVDVERVSRVDHVEVLSPGIRPYDPIMWS